MIRYVFDTGAVMAYTHGVEAIGQILYDAAEDRHLACIPSTCLLEAYSLTEGKEHDLLRLLRMLPVVVIDHPLMNVRAADELENIGVLTRLSGRLGAGHAAIVAMASYATVVTSRIEQMQKALTDNWPITEV